MIRNNKVSMKQLRDATDVLMRFLEEYQTVNLQNADAIVEYQGKLKLIAAPLNTKKFARFDSYSFVDLIKKAEPYAGAKTDGFVLFPRKRRRPHHT
jgi:hypothetical protein